MLKKIIGLMGAGSFGNIINLVVYPMILLTYSASDYGKYALFFVPISILSVFANLKFDVLIIKSKRCDRFFYKRCGELISLFTCVMFSPLVLLYYYFMSLNAPFLLTVFACIYSYLFIYTQQSIALNISGENYKYAGILVFFQTSSLGVFQIVMNNFVSGYMGLIYGCLASSVFLFVVSFFITFNDIGKKGGVSLLGCVKLVEKEYSTCVNGSFQSLVNSLSVSIVTTHLAFFYDDKVVGLFNFCLKVLMIPSRLMMSSFRTVITNSIKKIDVESQKRLCVNYSFILFVSSTCLFSFVYIVADSSLLGVFLQNNNWVGFSDYIVPISIWLVSIVSQSALVSFLTVNNLLIYHLYYEWVNFICRLMLGLLSFFLCSLNSSIDYIYIVAVMTAVLTVMFFLKIYKVQVDEDC